MITIANPDPLDLEIDAAKRAVADAERKLEMGRVMLAALEKAASLRPRHSNGVVRHASAVDFDSLGHQRIAVARGKAPGALSTQWRSIMQNVVTAGNSPLTPDLWALTATEGGYPMDTKTARDWLRRAASSEFGFIVRDGDAYRVSDAAIERFSLKVAEPPLEVPSDGSE